MHVVKGSRFSRRNAPAGVWSERREQFIAELIRDNDPLVYQQEYLAEFVDWAGVAFFARDKLSRRAPLLILDWDIAQIEGALLETWLPMVFERLEELSRLCGARHRLGWRMDRGQKLRNNPVTAGYPQAMASNRH